jgi:hypothetical protein
MKSFAEKLRKIIKYKAIARKLDNQDTGYWMLEKSVAFGRLSHWLI